MTKHGDLYYEGKEFEVKMKVTNLLVIRLNLLVDFFMLFLDVVYCT
jgi:hypothetical protein